MASGGKRGASDRVLESKHVIGLFLLMLLFSGVFFTLGYVMGRNQYDGQVRAAMNADGQAGARLHAEERSGSEEIIHRRRQFRRAIPILRQILPRLRGLFLQTP